MNRQVLSQMEANAAEMTENLAEAKQVGIIKRKRNTYFSLARRFDIVSTFSTVEFLSFLWKYDLPTKVFELLISLHLTFLIFKILQNNQIVL